LDLPSQPLFGISVLYVEDDADAREVMALVLEHLGAVVRPAGTADEALASFVANPAMVVLADIAMPDHDGFWLLREVAGDEMPPVPFIAFTGLCGARDREEVLAAGFVDYLLKPVENDVLIDAVRTAVGKAADRPATRLIAARSTVEGGEARAGG
jgi:CheY-like chemotaxis protein